MVVRTRLFTSKVLQWPQGVRALSLTRPSFVPVMATAPIADNANRSGSGSLMGLACGLAMGSSVLALVKVQNSQHLNCEATRRVRLGMVTDFDDGSMQEVQVGPEESKAVVLLHRHNGEFYATSPTCCHYGMPLKKGVTTAGLKGAAPSVACSFHDATFDLKSGLPTRGPSLDGIATYQVHIVDGTVYADVPENIVAGAKHKRIVPPMKGRDPKDERVFAIIGGGGAALAAAETLRQDGFGGRLVMLTKEKHLPYDRVQLSKRLDQSAEKLALRSAEFFDEWDIEVMRETLVSKLDSKGQKVHFKSADSEEGQVLAYDKVLVATGGLPRKLFCPGATLPGVMTLRTPEDAAQIHQYATKGKKIVVVGGSFIGMEIASSLRKQGCEVSVVAMETVPFERVLGKKVGASFARLLQRQGVQWFGNAQVRLFRGDEAVSGVELEDGEVLPADAVVVGAGVLPNTRFVEGVSFDKNGAIIVGPLLASETVPSLYAAGDVCSYPALQAGQQTRIEHWDVATQQGRVAAKNMLGQYTPFTTIPFFWSGLFGVNMRFAGYAPEMLDRVIIEGDVGAMEFISYYTENDEIKAVCTINKDPVAVACAELMRRGKMPKVSELMLNIVNADVILQRVKELSAATA